MDAVDIPLRHAHHHDLFICFNSRFSFNLSSTTKPLRTSPARPDRLVRETPLSSVSSSSSFTATRHLRNNNAKPSGQASPMFPSSSQNKRGCHFETAEPSSPTVTCIGQVRVKKKKKKEKTPPQNINPTNNLRSRSGVSGGGEFSFRMMDEEEPPSHISGRNQKWVHLPFASCFFFCPQRRKEKEQVAAAACAGDLPHRRRRGSCAAALSRCVLALHPDQKEEEHAAIDGHLNFREEEDDDEEDVVCEPPRNALLLMRCRSDPSRISALSTHFLDSIPPTLPEKEQRSALSEEGEDFHGVLRADVAREGVFSEEEEEMEGGDEYDDEGVVTAYLGMMMSECDSPTTESRAADSAEVFPIGEGVCSETNEDDDGDGKEMNAIPVVEEGRGVGEKKEEEEKKEVVIPDCFLMMMRREAKVSTEVSKETWVCSSDFLQRLPRRRINPVDDKDGRLKKQLLLPPRSSCCLPGGGVAAGVSMAAMIEQRLAAAAAFEPVVLTRCKSEPVRPAQEVCRWRKRTAVVGIGAAGVGF